jgi:lipoprotein-releasing system permease protein
LEVTLQPGADAAQVKQELQSRLGGEYKVLLRDENNSIYRLMALEKWGVFLISLVVMIIASLTIVGTLVMIIIDKREERATLLTLGATPSFVRGVFVAEGDIMVRRSLIVGLLAGIVLTLVQQFFGIVQIDAATLMVDAYPVELQLWDVVAVAVGYYVIAKIIIWLTVRAMLKN